MGGLMAAISAIRAWGCSAPHLRTHFDCSCSNDSTSSEEMERNVRKTTTWLERHRPAPGMEAKHLGVATARSHHTRKEKEAKQSQDED